MTIYEYVRTTTIRGSKVRKILKMLKTYEIIYSDPRYQLSEMSENKDTPPEELDIQIYSMNDVVENIKLFIKTTFDRDSYKKSDFKKKAFAGAKMVSVLNYIDLQIIRAENNINYLNNVNSISSTLNKVSFKCYWEQQINSLHLVKKLILAQYLNLRDEENNYIYEFLLNIEDED